LITGGQWKIFEPMYLVSDIGGLLHMLIQKL